MTEPKPSTPGRPPLYFEDFTVGMRFVSPTHQLDEGQVTTFARAFDPQPFHLDAEAAKATLLEGLAASGWHTAAVSMRLLIDSGLAIAGGIFGAGGELAWPVPTRPHDVLHVQCDVIGLRLSRSRPDRGIVKVRNETHNQRGEIVQVFTCTLVVPRRPEGAPVAPR